LISPFNDSRKEEERNLVNKKNWKSEHFHIETELIEEDMQEQIKANTRGDKIKHRNHQNKNPVKVLEL
jgi:hypothetical protein